MPDDTSPHGDAIAADAAAVLPSAMRVKEFINSNRVTPVESVDEPLHLDSLEFLRVTTFIQNELGYTISDDELTSDNFATLGSIGRLLEAKAPV